MSTQPTNPKLVVAYCSIIDFRKASAAEKRALFSDLITYAARMGATPAFCLVEWSFEEAPSLGPEAWEARSFCDVYGCVFYWGRRLFCQKSALQRTTILHDITTQPYYEVWLDRLIKECKLLRALSCGDTEPYNSAENWLDAFQDETCLSLGSLISSCCKKASTSLGGSLDLLMPLGSGTDKAFQHSFGPLSGSGGLQCNNWYRYLGSIVPKLPPHFQWSAQIAFSHVAPSKIPVSGSTVLATWTPDEWHQGWSSVQNGKPVMSQRMIYCGANQATGKNGFEELRTVLSMLVALP